MADGLLQRGLIIRLLVLPNDIGGIRESLEWIRDELSPRVAISLMAQYYPTHQAATSKRHVLLSRRITENEWLRAVSALEELGMEEGWMQEFDGASYYYRPDFDNPETPFKDIEILRAHNKRYASTALQAGNYRSDSALRHSRGLLDSRD